MERLLKVAKGESDICMALVNLWAYGHNRAV